MKQYKMRVKFSTEQIQNIINDYNLNHSIKETADNYKCGQGTIKRILTSNNIKVYNYKEYFEKFGNNLEEKKEQIIDLYTNQNKNITEIGRLFDLDSRIISRFLRKNKITPHLTNYQSLLKANKDLVIEIYKRNKTLKAVSDHFGCDSMSVSLFFENENISYNKYKGHSTQIFNEKDKINIENLIIEQHKTAKEIAVLYNCTAPKIMSYCDKNNIKRLSRSDQSKINGCLSVDSTFHRKSYTLPSGKIIYLMGYEPQFLNYIFKRHKFLSEDEVIYKVPKIRYFENNKPRWYFPDFYIPKFNLIIEVKSSWTLQKQTTFTQQLKEQATIAAGFNYIMILNNDFSIFEYKYFKDL